MSSSHASHGSSVIPAQLAFLAIYNPAFGDTDETAYEQIFYYYSRLDKTLENQSGQGASHFDGAGGSKPEGKQDRAKTQEEVRNEHLRKVGLARGMVEFANTFSNGVSVDSIETEKSRLVLQELESGWWVLASIDLTRLPAAAKTSSNDSNEKSSGVEYSSREVSPPHLLLMQLQRAHSLFLLHHGSGLDEVHSRLGRELFCGTLERYWNRFIWDWDVLLHGNPAVDTYNATKLAGGGELGIGVGEEEWGSGEREVLEDFVRRTEGLVDVVVGRYGDPPSDVKEEASPETKAAIIRETKPWLGVEEHPSASDGIIFSGIGDLSKRSLTTVSEWIEAIFRHGQSAYGVGDNPTSRPRQRRKRRTHHAQSSNGAGARTRSARTTEVHPRLKSPGGRAPDLRRKAMENNAAPPGIPAPLVGSVERSLDQAIANVQKREGSQTRKKDDAPAKTLDAMKNEEESSYFDTDKMIGYLKLGYGSSWTLNPKGFDAQKDEAPDPKASGDTSTSEQAEPDPPPLQELDPTPDVSDTEEEEAPFVQRLEQSIGKFLIGLSGDLENAEFEGDAGNDNPSAAEGRTNTQRIVMRTLNVQLSKSYQANMSTSATMSEAAPADYFPPSSETAKLRVVLYTHQPFIFVFLFDLQTPSLTMPSFYRSIHHQLGPLQKPLLRSTDPTRIPERIAMHMDAKSDGNAPAALGLYDLVYDPVKMTVRTSIPNIPMPGTLAAEGILDSSASASGASRTVSGAWYTLGIPIGSVPGSSSAATAVGGSADGGVVKTEWTRIEALNVHTQILNTWTGTRPHTHINMHTSGTDATRDFERTVKTSRGWWIVWLRVPRHGGLSAPASAIATPTASRTRMPTLRKEETDETMIAEMGGGEREAFLVRKSVETGSKSGKDRGASAGRWLMPEKREVSGMSTGSGGGSTSAKGVVEGVGVDARRWVEGLSRLS